MPSGFFGRATVLGIDIVFESNSQEALNAALSVFPDCTPCEPSIPVPSVYVVLEADRAGHARVESNRIHGKQLQVVRDGIVLQADGESRRGTCSFPVDVTRGAVFQEAVQTIVLFLVAQADRIPVHASAVMIADRAYVMAGRSGSGKSTLALAATRAGLPVLAEDTVFVQLDPSFKVRGLVQRIHLFEKDAPAGTGELTRLRSGRLKRALEIGEVRHSADKAALCILARGERVIISPISPDDAVRTLTSDPEPGYDFYGTRMEQAIRAVAAGGSWLVTLTENPDAAIAVLIDKFGDLSISRQST